MDYEILNFVNTPTCIWDQNLLEIKFCNEAWPIGEKETIELLQALPPTYEVKGEYYFVTEKRKEHLKIVSLEREGGFEEFVYLASHNLKEPVRKISTFAERLQHSLQIENSRDQLFFSKLIDATSRATGMIDALLQLSRVHTYTDTDSIDIETFLVELTNQKKINTTIDIAGNIPSTIHLNRSMLNLVFNELLENSMKFKASKVHIDVAHTEHTLIIKYLDDGIGVPIGMEHKALKPLVQLNGKNEFKGNGMGLALVAKTLEKNNGSITINPSQDGFNCILKWSTTKNT